MTKGQWYWVAGKGPMQFVKLNEERADPVLMYTPNGQPYNTKRACVGTEPMTVAELEKNRTQLAEKGIHLGPVERWGTVEVDEQIDWLLTDENLSEAARDTLRKARGGQS